MDSQTIKYQILNYDYTPEEVYDLYIEDNFRETIRGFLTALYELSINYDKGKNKQLVQSILQILGNIAKTDTNPEHISYLLVEGKKLKGHIIQYKNQNSSAGNILNPIIDKLDSIIKHLKKVRDEIEDLKKLDVMENLILNGKNLNLVTALIRDNKNILQIRDSNNQNILFRLLKKYSLLPSDSADEIDYLYQVISLFANSDILNVNISSNIDYYISALKNRGSQHVREIMKLLQKKQKVSLEELKAKYKIITRAPYTFCHEQSSLSISEDGIYDLRHLQTCTIDGEGAICLDDAFSLVANKDGSYTLYMFTAFVPALVPYDSPLNQQSIDAVETHYLIDSVETLYPEIISNDLGSLLQGKERHAEVGILTIRPDFTIEEGSYRLVRGIILSDHQLCYDGGDAIIHKNQDDSLTKMLIASSNIANILRASNPKKEKYRKSENAQNSDPHHESRYVDQSPSANIIQEFSLLNGRTKTSLIAEKGYSYNFRACAEQQCFSLNGEYLKSFTGNLDEIGQIIRCFAYYTNKPERHHALDYPVYGHVGSPLRRSPDGQNQYIDLDLIFNPNPSDERIYFWEEQTKKLVAHYNESASRIASYTRIYNFLTTHNALVRERRKNN